MTTTTDAIVQDLTPTRSLRAAINLGNPVLAQGTPADPAGVTVDIAREIARRLDVAVEFSCFDAARKSHEASVSGQADICFLAIEPARATEVAFTPPYVVIEGVFAVPQGSALTSVADVDQIGVRIGVKQRSAYDLFLTRTLKRATIVRGSDGVKVFREDGLDVAAGIRQPLDAFVETNPDVRLIDGAFMQIRQAVGTSRVRRPETVDYLCGLVEELKASGFVRDALWRSGQGNALVAPPA